MTPTITMLAHITTDPTRSMGLRPTLSMINYKGQQKRAKGVWGWMLPRTMAGMVLTMKTTPVTPVANNAMVPPVNPRLTKTLDA
jgi:hypothetical protein